LSRPCTYATDGQATDHPLPHRYGNSIAHNANKLHHNQGRSRTRIRAALRALIELSVVSDCRHTRPPTASTQPGIRAPPPGRGVTITPAASPSKITAERPSPAGMVTVAGGIAV
jgi:hypothetical protein